MTREALERTESRAEARERADERRWARLRETDPDRARLEFARAITRAEFSQRRAA